MAKKPLTQNQHHVSKLMQYRKLQVNALKCAKQAGISPEKRRYYIRSYRTYTRFVEKYLRLVVDGEKVVENVT